jgi:hypothetical protein
MLCRPQLCVGYGPALPKTQWLNLCCQSMSNEQQQTCVIIVREEHYLWVPAPLEGKAKPFQPSLTIKTYVCCCFACRPQLCGGLRPEFP